MSDFKFSNLKKPLLSAALLKATPVLMGKGGIEPEGGKSQLGINHLILEETPGRNATICTRTGSESRTQGQWMPSDLVVVVDPFESDFIEIAFSVREMLPADKDRMLLLTYSQKLTPSPELLTPRSLNELQLDINTLEVLGLYNIPARSMLPQSSTRIGMAHPALRSIASFSVNLNTEMLRYYMENKKSIYLQAALLPRSDFEAGDFEPNMILSEVDVISFVKMECPEDRQDFIETTIPGDVIVTK